MLKDFKDEDFEAKIKNEDVSVICNFQLRAGVVLVRH